MDTRIDWELKADMQFTKNSIREFIEEAFAKENPEEDELWMRKAKTPNLTYFIKKGGSDLST